MLKLIIPANELFDEATSEFVPVKACELTLEHSLVSLSKWESKWNKPFLAKGEKTIEESIDYIRCMTLTQNVPPDAYKGITNANMRLVNAYIEAPMTATIISKRPGPPNHDIITSEIIYYWMISLGIPFECQKWHLNRLMTLINVCNIKNSPAKKMSRREILSNNARLNAQRRSAWNTRG